MTCFLITICNNDLLFCISDFLAVQDIRALAATCGRLFSILNQQLYLVDVMSGRCDAVWWACLHNLQPILGMSLASGASPNQIVPFARKYDNTFREIPWSLQFNIIITR